MVPKFGVQSGLAEAAKGFSSGQLSSIFNPANFGVAWTFLKVFGYFAILVLGAIIFYKYWLQYKINITIKTRLGGSQEIKQDKAKIVEDEQGKKKLILLKTRRGKTALTCPVPAGIYKSKVGRKDHYELWLDDNFQLHPIGHPQTEFYDSEGNVVNLEPEQAPQLKLRPQERDAWARYESKRIAEKYKSKDLLMQYLPAGILFIAMITAFLIWFFAVGELGDGMAQIATQLAQVASACTVN